jgi:hypothetical protein
LASDKDFWKKHRGTQFLLGTVFIGLLFLFVYYLASQRSYVIFLFIFVYLYFIYDLIVALYTKFSEKDRHFLRLWPLSILGTFFGILVIVTLIMLMIEGTSKGRYDGGAFFLFTLVFAMTFFGFISIFRMLKSYKGNYLISRDSITFVSGKDREELEFKDVLCLGVDSSGLLYSASDKKELKLLESMASFYREDSEFANKASQLRVFVGINAKSLISDLERKGFKKEEKKGLVLLRR